VKLSKLGLIGGKWKKRFQYNRAEKETRENCSINKELVRKKFLGTSSRSNLVSGMKRYCAEITKFCSNLSRADLPVSILAPLIKFYSSRLKSEPHLQLIRPCRPFMCFIHGIFVPCDLFKRQ